MPDFGIAAFRDQTASSRLLKNCLAAFLVVTLLSLWFGWREIGILDRLRDGDFVADEEIEASDNGQMAIAILSGIVYLTTAIIFLRWIYVSQRNAKALGADGLRFTPGWAVGWYFVPFATYWKPYQAMRETFRASHPDYGPNWQEAPRAPILPAWWTLWILHTAIGRTSTRLMFRADTIEDYLASSRLSFTTDLLALLLTGVAILLVTQLQALQDAKQRSLNAAASVAFSPEI